MNKIINRRIDRNISTLESLISETFFLFDKAEWLKRSKYSQDRGEMYVKFIKDFSIWRRLAHWIIGREIQSLTEVGKYTFIDNRKISPQLAAWVNMSA